MKPVKIVIFVALCVFAGQLFGQGSSCSNPYLLTLDGVSRSYTISSNSGSAANCSGTGFNGSGKQTIFSFTTDASASPVLVYISTTPVQPVEITLYTGCASNGSCSNIQSTSSVCFADGEGYWAADALLTLSPNTTYYLRAWTANAGTITLSGRNYNPPNNLCSGATRIGPDAIDDNNACNKASAEVAAVQLCASTLENTAFYTYFVQADGTSSVQLNNISCDNSDAVPGNGFQIGFFVGTCGSLVKITCATGAGGSVTASTGWLLAGTQVFVAIDGSSGSNCSYKISAFNATVLPITLKYFTSWKRPDANRLTWLTTSEKDLSHFEIEKSTDGTNFLRIGSVTGKGNTSKETSYLFDDNELRALQFYRLKYVEANGQSSYSNVLRVNRDDISKTKVIFNNKVTNMLALRVTDMEADNLSIRIIDNSGKELKVQQVKINPGDNLFNLNVGSIPAGFYYLMLSADNYKRTFSFVKS